MDYFLIKQINSLAGQWQWLDMVGIIFSDFLIFSFPLIIILIYFFSNKRNKLIWVLIKVVLSTVLSIVLSYLISQLVARPRPFVDHQEIYQLAKFIIGLKDFSFPSDHATVAFAMTLSVLVDWRKFGLILLGLALLVGLSRIFVGVHYPSDILGGIVVAIISVTGVEYVLERLIKNNFLIRNYK